jgi:hypothetical protein
MNQLVHGSILVVTQFYVVQSERRRARANFAISDAGYDVLDMLPRILRS